MSYNGIVPHCSGESLEEAPKLKLVLDATIYLSDRPPHDADVHLQPFTSFGLELSSRPNKQFLRPTESDREFQVRLKLIKHKMAGLTQEHHVVKCSM